jgi:hypothetical protein
MLDGRRAQIASAFDPRAASEHAPETGRRAHPRIAYGKAARRNPGKAYNQER